MFVFKRAPRRSLSDLESFLREVGDQPVVWLEREVKSWGEFSYAELEDLILSGRAADLIDWQSRYAKVVNEKFNPLWLAAIARASYNSTRGKITIDDSDPRVKDFLRQRAAELIRDLSDESRRAIANVILHGQSERLAPKEIARQIRPLIGLNQRQAQANVNYRQKIFRQLIDNGLSATVANQRANKAAIKYASKQHRQRAEMIVHTELARAYNQGAHEGVLAAQRAGLMNVCEMVWTTAGTNRVCGRCLSLKDTVVGHTNEVGVQLPPLHPRCRCTISYREMPLTAPQNPLTVPEIQTLVSTVIKPDNPSKLNALLKIYATDEYVVVDNASKIPAYYDLDSGKIVYNPNHTALKYYNLTTAFTHEVMHLIDIENGIAVSLSNAIFTATEETKRLIFERKEHYEQLLDGDLGLNMSVSDLVAAITDSQIHGAYAHNANYWLGLGHTEREIVANLATIYYAANNEGTAFVNALPPLKTLFEEVKQHYETCLDTFSRRRVGVNASRPRRTAGRTLVLSA